MPTALPAVKASFFFLYLTIQTHHPGHAGETQIPVAWAVFPNSHLSSGNAPAAASSAWLGFSNAVSDLTGSCQLQAVTGKMRPLSSCAVQESIPNSPSHSQLDWGRQGGRGEKSIN